MKKVIVKAKIKHKVDFVKRLTDTKAYASGRQSPFESLISANFDLVDSPAAKKRGHSEK